MYVLWFGILPAIGYRTLFASAAFLMLLVPSEVGASYFSPTGSLTTPRSRAVAAPLPDGRVLVAGGLNNGDLASAEIFDPATNTFSATGIGSMTTPRRYAFAAPLQDGRVLIGGGTSGSDSAVASAEIFDAATNTFSPTGSMTTPRTRHAVAAPLPDGRVLVAGGSPDFDNAIASAEVFDPATQTFSAAGIGAMTVPRRYAVGAPLPDGRVLVTGGTDGSQFFASSEVFDPTTNTFSATGVGSMSMARTRAVAAPLADGRVLVVSGTVDEITVFPSSEAFDPATGAFSSEGIGPIGTPRYYAAAAPLPGGRVLIAGGYAGGANLQTAEIFVPGPDPGAGGTVIGLQAAPTEVTGRRCVRTKKKRAKRKQKRRCRVVTDVSRR